MRRELLMIALAGCGFSANLGTDPGTDGSPGVDSSTMQPDDGAPTMTPVVRRIDIGTGKVTGGPHTDFPLLVTAAITSAHPMGYDIFFSTDQAGTQKLAHEIERYQTNALVAWVKVPSLSSTTQLYLHYGDPTITTSQEDRAAVWSASYAAVWHLSDLSDATAQNNGTNNGTTAMAGKIADARAFNGTGNTIAAGSDASIDDVFAGGGTVEAWFTATSWGQGNLGRIFDKGDGRTLLAMCDQNVSASLQFGHDFTGGNGNWCTGQNTLQQNQWTYVAVLYNSDSSANDPTFYINGVARGISASNQISGSSISDAADTLIIGDRSSGSRAFAGRIDELRLSTAIRSAGWITTSYENQRDPAAFAIVSAPL